MSAEGSNPIFWWKKFRHSFFPSGAPSAYKLWNIIVFQLENGDRFWRTKQQRQRRKIKDQEKGEDKGKRNAYKTPSILQLFEKKCHCKAPGDQVHECNFLLWTLSPGTLHRFKDPVSRWSIGFQTRSWQKIDTGGSVVEWLGRLAQEQRSPGRTWSSPHVFTSAARLCGLPVINAPKRPIEKSRESPLSRASNSGLSWNHWASMALNCSDMHSTQWASAE
jgi:hypothetical protein